MPISAGRGAASEWRAIPPPLLGRWPTDEQALFGLIDHGAELYAQEHLAVGTETLVSE